MPKVEIRELWLEVLKEQRASMNHKASLAIAADKASYSKGKYLNREGINALNKMISAGIEFEVALQEVKTKWERKG